MVNKTQKDYEKDYTQPKLREELKEKIKGNNKGGKSGRWSARKSQMLAQAYEKEGGGYKHSGQKNKAQQELTHWGKQNKS